ncbi:SET domain-containing protein 5 [Hypsizygus marmoreus]|uniref:SET domain-containing protein 5 n=1 Tax=Hypsizygus marmoreus TaxID=39966 RepID=A0A369K922_HYPMA|nr:SET domain-containing protein 5 [Hypsizygus marmoreus]
MKRGFLNTKKAARLVELHAPNSPPTKLQPIEANLAVGGVRTDNLPEVSSSTYNISRTMPLNDAYVSTTIPNREDGATLADYPDNWTECIFPGPRPAHAILNMPYFPSHVPKPPMPRHRIHATSAMGLGFFATCDLRMGDLIFAERPLVVMPHALAVPVDNSTPLEQRPLAVAMGYERVLEQLVQKMIPENWAALKALANVHKADETGPIFGIVKTNAFDIFLNAEEASDAIPYSAVFDKISRINHGCIPNAELKFDIHSFSYSLRPVRDIKKGEQIFVSYCDTNEGTAARRQALTPYGFVCSCPRCTDPASDGLRRQISKSLEPLFQYSSASDQAAVLAESVMWMKTIEGAGLQILREYSVHIFFAAKAAKALGHTDEFERYRRMRNNWHKAMHGQIPLDGLL